MVENQSMPDAGSRQRYDTPARQWRAVTKRDRAADGWFVYGVLTTGIYCRPSCPSRRANRCNVRFYASAADAEQAGLRPCKRCQPDQRETPDHRSALIAKLCRMIERAETPPTLETLARHAKMSRFHLLRVFRNATGVTPAVYAKAHRGARVRHHLLTPSASVTHAIYASGFNSSGRFYAASDGLVGMKPADFRAGGRHTRIRFALAQTSLGVVLIAASDKGVCAITLGDEPEPLLRDLQDRFPQAELLGGDAAFERMIAMVVGFIEKPHAALDLPLDIRGTAFQHRVWHALQQIPLGTTVTYSDIARKIGSPRAVRAVAQACARNPAAIAVPCHRVVRTDGALSGYRWGLARKRALIDREAKAAQQRRSSAE